MKNIDYINKYTSKELGVSEKTVDLVNSFYWNSVKTRMRALKSQGIHIKELGTMEVSPFKISEFIKKLRVYIKNIRGSHKYTETRKEKIIADYKKSYKKCIDMNKIVQDDLEFKNTYKNV